MTRPASPEQGQAARPSGLCRFRTWLGLSISAAGLFALCDMAWNGSKALAF